MKIQFAGIENEIWAKHRTAAMLHGDKHFHKDDELAKYAFGKYGQFLISVIMFVTLRHCGCSVLGPDLILHVSTLINIGSFSPNWRTSHIVTSCV